MRKKNSNGTGRQFLVKRIAALLGAALIASCCASTFFAEERRRAAGLTEPAVWEAVL